MKILPVLVMLAFITISFSMAAAEVKNIKGSQVGDKAVATYDLVGSAGKQEAEVTVAIIVNGERKTSDKLHLTGDFGKAVKVGTGKKIVIRKSPIFLQRKTGKG